MTELAKAQLEEVVANYVDSYLGISLAEAKAVRDIQIKDNQIVVAIELGYPCKSHEQEIVTALTKQLNALTGVADIHVQVNSNIIAHAVQAGVPAIPQVKNIIAIASGKGGVGKSTVAVNLALALAAEGAQVGILDADIYGPSQPLLLGVTEKPEMIEKRINPIIQYGVQSMSIGYLIDPDTPMVWRGPMVSSALQQLLNDTNWQALDYLVIDLPPGTGDIQLTLAQKIPVSGAVIVTTPQDIALLDARKAIAMFQKVKVPVLGVVENMSMHTCSQCGHQEPIFGSGGGEQLAQQYQVDLLGSLPLEQMIREQADKGVPVVRALPNSATAQHYHEIALKLAAKLSLQAKNYAVKFPKIVIENR